MTHKTDKQKQSVNSAEELAEDLNDAIYQIQKKYANGELTPKEADQKCIDLINQFKEEMMPSEKEVDKARKQKWEEYKHPSGTWVAYSNGFMDAINWLRNLTAPDPE